MFRNTVGRDSDPLSFTIPIALNGAALVLILISQTYFLRIFEASETELPFQTQIALGVLPLIILSTVLLLTLVLKLWANVRLKSLWRPVAVSATGLVVGQHVMAVWLAFLPQGPVDLSFRFPTNSSQIACCDS